MQKPILPLGGVVWQSPCGTRLPLMAALILAFGFTRPGYAAECSCPAGDVTCLIEAIHVANATGEANTITLEAGTYTLTAVNNDTDGPNGLPSVTGNLTITGAGADTTILERAAEAPLFPLLHVADIGTLTLEGLTLQGETSQAFRSAPPSMWRTTPVVAFGTAVRSR